MTNHKTSRVLPRLTRLAAGGLVLFAGASLSTIAMAAGLRVDAEPATQAASARIRIANEGAGALSQVRAVGGSDAALACNARTRSGRAFAGTLQAGDSVACTVDRAEDAAQAAFAVMARNAEGTAIVRPVRLATLRGAMPPQSALVLSAGSVHEDGNGDGLLDAGETIDYHYTVVNVGNLTADGISLVDITGPVICTATTLAPAAHTTCTSTYTIDAADDAIGEVLNIAELTAVDIDGGVVTAGDLVLRLDLDGDAGTSVFKSPLLVDDADASGFASTGDRIRYIFVAKNTDAQALALVNLVEPDPTLIDTPITCAATTLGGNAFAALGAAELASWDTVVCTAEYTIRAEDDAAGAAHNLVEASGQPQIGPAVFATGASTVVIPTGASVVVEKALVGEGGAVPGVAEPGESLTYAITLTNSGGSNAPAFAVTDVLDPNTVFVSANNGGMHAGGTITWDSLLVPANDSLVLTVAVTVADPLPAGALRIANLAHETGTPAPTCPPAGPGCVVTPTVGAVSLSKTVEDDNGDGLAEPGEALSYEITLTNAGGSDVTGFDVVDALDASTVFVSADNSGVHDAGVVTWNDLTVPAGGALTLNVEVRVIDPLPLSVVEILNLAYEAGNTPPDCAADPRPAGCAPIGVLPVPQLAITKTVDSPEVEAGGTAIYTITVSNTGTADLVDVQVVDPLPTGVVGFEWTCEASGGAECPQADGTGAIQQLVPSFPSGGELVYTVSAQIARNPPDSIVNTALVTPSDVATCLPGGTPAPCSADVEVMPEGETPPPAAPRPVPTQSQWALIAMALLMLAVAGLRMRPARVRR
jgi:uncharacterized repeat protein (TIGR01451 family)